MPLENRAQVIKSNGMLVRIKTKPQPSKRFQRRNVDSMWQDDTFQFRISSTGKVYVTGFTDDCSRYRIISKAYLHKGAAEAVNVLCHALREGFQNKSTLTTQNSSSQKSSKKSLPNTTSSQSMAGRTILGEGER